MGSAAKKNKNIFTKKYCWEAKITIFQSFSHINQKYMIFDSKYILMQNKVGFILFQNVGARDKH